MILTGKEIINRLGGDIVISPFDVEQVNPNSYNLRLGNELQVYENETLDSKINNNTMSIEIPESGYLLEKGKLYLAKTLEYTETINLVPMLNGRSSIARLGLFVHVTAGFGDIGFRGYWTLELLPSKNILVYPNMKICQIYYVLPYGIQSIKYDGKYQDNHGIQSSKYYTEF